MAKYVIIYKEDQDAEAKVDSFEADDMEAADEIACFNYQGAFLCLTEEEAKSVVCDLGKVLK